MDSNNWRPNQGGTEPTVDTSNWRDELPPDSRQRIVDTIMNTIKRYLPVSGNDGLLELRKIAQRFEEKIFTAATNQTDYLRKISVKMLTMENKYQNPVANNMPSNQVGPSNNPPDQVNLNLMDSNNWKPNQGGTEPTVDTSNWRDELPPDSRQRIVDKIINTLKRYFPVSGNDGLLELWMIAQRFEEKIFTAATNQTDYLRKISVKMLTMENKYQNPVANNMPSNQVGPSNNPPDQENQTTATNNNNNICVQDRQMQPIINCGLYINLEGISHSMNENTRKSPEPKKELPEPPKPPVFDCPICMAPLVEEMSTRCGHIFCKKCIKAAISKQGKCPTCRKKVTARELIRVFLPSAS